MRITVKNIGRKLLIAATFIAICSCVSTIKEKGGQQLEAQDNYYVAAPTFGHRVTTIREDAIRYGVKVLASGKSFKKVLPVSKGTISQRCLCGDMKWMMIRK